jgi:L-alanine-DL-glutamate epimerase-like enolase superfamily enzyme
MAASIPTIERVTARAFCVPTDAAEADGTLAWDRTTIVVTEVSAGGAVGLGYTYAAAEAAHLINQTFAEVLSGADAFAIPKAWDRIYEAARNLGSRGVCANAISAVDAALWDLKARILDRPLVHILGASRDTVPIYGSGGFTSYPRDRLTEQLSSWVEQDGCRWVKMKVGSEPEEDVARVKAARSAIGSAGLFVDANGAFARKEAIAFAERFAEFGVSWFEEPVSSDDLDGLRLARDRAPAQMEIAAGEYGYEPRYFRRMIDAGAVDVIQADATRCCGITGFMRAAAVADAASIPLSAHTAPALHLHVCCAAPRLRHIEWFHDHVRIERMLFDGAPVPDDGKIQPDLSRPGHGLELRRADAERFAISQ